MKITATIVAVAIFMASTILSAPVPSKSGSTGLKSPEVIAALKDYHKAAAKLKKALKRLDNVEEMNHILYTVHRNRRLDEVSSDSKNEPVSLVPHGNLKLNPLI